MAVFPSKPLNYEGLTTTLNLLYRTSQIELKAKKADTSKVHKAFNGAVKKVYKKKGFTPDMLSDPKIKGLIDEIYNVLSESIHFATGEEESSELIEKLDSEAYNFSGFKTYHQMNEASGMLQQEGNSPEPFTDYLKRVKAVDAKYNENWLQTEYNLFQNTAAAAQQWEDYSKTGNRYDLQYRTAADDRVREEHAALHGTTLTYDDPFWDMYYPPNGYGCRCTVIQVIKGKYKTSNSQAAIDIGNKMTEGKAKSIFRFNPGKTKKPYPSKHPYMPQGCGDCQNGLRLAYNKNSQACQACTEIARCKSLNIHNIADDKFCKVWIEETIKKVFNGKICKIGIAIYEMPKEIISFAKKHQLRVADTHIILSDKQIKHALRSAKKNAKKAISIEDMINIKDNLAKANILYDSTNNSYLFVLKTKNEYIKYVINTYYKEKINNSKTKIPMNYFITAGIFDKRHMNMYTKLK